jgi:threonyl-tRNA synthetase
MRILQLHSDYIEYEPLRKEIRDAEEAEKKRYRLEDVLVLFTCVEEGDDESLARIVIKDVKEFMQNVKCEKILIYPYAHLSQKLADPLTALDVVKAVEEEAKKQGIETYRAPFGWNKQFAIQIKAHPLAEQSRTYYKGMEERAALVKEYEFPIKFEPKDEREKIWHTAIHLLASAVKRLYPEAQLGIGGVVDDGFYYDFGNIRLSKDDLLNIEQEMIKIAKESSISELNLSKDVAVNEFSNERFKSEVVVSIKENVVPIIKIDGFIDICKSKHANINDIKAVKLTSIAGAYWRGDASQPMLQRIYGIAYKSREELEKELRYREEVERRDHRRLGERLELFGFHEEAPGIPFLRPKGVILRNILLDFWRKMHYEAGYKEIATPAILNKALWVKSGHWENYREYMFLTRVEGIDYAIKPMNCPGAILTFMSKERSYRELPLRLAEVGLVHRHELSGVLSGLFRVRAFTQDDAHIFLMPEQLEDEILRIIDLTDKIYKIFGFEYHVELSTRPERYIGSEEAWEHATNALKRALERKGMKYIIREGEGAFYGPKIDFHIRDALGRTWQCATIQVDFAMPERFNVTYIGADGKAHKPVIVHRVIYGSLERFIAILLEYYAGNLPVWISPIQVIVIPVADEYIGYAEEVFKKIKDSGIRVEIDKEHATVSYKIRNAQLQKIPYMLVVGKKEVESNTLAVRTRDGKVKYEVSLNEFISEIKEQIKNYK